jgi:hypothetical protein
MVGIPPNSSLSPANLYVNSNNPNNIGPQNSYFVRQQQQQNSLKHLLIKYNCQLKADDDDEEELEEEEESQGFGSGTGHSFAVKKWTEKY